MIDLASMNEACGYEGCTNDGERPARLLGKVTAIPADPGIALLGDPTVEIEAELCADHWSALRQVRVV